MSLIILLVNYRRFFKLFTIVEESLKYDELVVLRYDSVEAIMFPEKLQEFFGRSIYRQFHRPDFLLLKNYTKNYPFIPDSYHSWR